MYNQFNLCKLCDDEPEVYNGLCRTCLDSSSEKEDVVIGGTRTEKFTHRRRKNPSKYDRHPPLDEE